jgi:ssDNA-binding Zn-finger/Zn-ribbon topoisomerase 1
MDAQDALQTAREVNGQCPKCGGEMETWHTEYMGIETFIRACIECDYQGVPE